MSLTTTIVVGAGIEGSAAAYHLIKSGNNNVVLLEQFERNHTRGSSCGHTRITRMAYRKSLYITLMKDAYQRWSDLEMTSGHKLFKQTGYLEFGRSDKQQVNDTIDRLQMHDIPHEVFTGHECNLRYSQTLKIPSTYKCVYDDKGGIIYASRALLAFQGEFLKLGGVLLDNHKVIDIIPGEIVTVVTNRGTFKTKNVVIATGPWTPSLCSTLGLHLPLKVKRVEVLYWKVDNPSAFSSDNFPTTFGYWKGIPSYGVPCEEYPDMIKICSNEGVWTDPDERDVVDTEFSTVSHIADYISSTFIGIASQPSIKEYCLYTMSPDYNPIIDRHPEHKNIVIAAGFNGHGFKLSPVFGKLISEIVMKETPSHDLHPFRITRFTTPNASL